MDSAPSESRYSLQTTSEMATEALGRVMGQLAQRGDVILLSGDLGAGKTHLTKGIARGLAVAEEITSPTFNLVLVHEGRMPLYHVDLYRLDSAEQLEEIGYYDAIEGDGLAVVEWGDRFPQARPAGFADVSLQIDDDETRTLVVEAAGERAVEFAAALRERAARLDGVVLGARS